MKHFQQLRIAALALWALGVHWLVIQLQYAMPWDVRQYHDGVVTSFSWSGYVASFALVGMLTYVVFLLARRIRPWMIGVVIGSALALTMVSVLVSGLPDTNLYGHGPTIYTQRTPQSDSTERYEVRRAGGFPWPYYYDVVFFGPDAQELSTEHFIRFGDALATFLVWFLTALIAVGVGSALHLVSSFHFDKNVSH